MGMGMGIMKDPYNVLLAIRLDADYRPVAAWQMPRDAVELVYPHGSRTSLTAKLLASPAVVSIEPAQLAAAAGQGCGPGSRLTLAGRTIASTQA